MFRVNFQVLLERRATRELQKISPNDSRKIRKKLKLLREPHKIGKNLKRLKKAITGYRLRVGDYRILFVIKNKHRVVHVHIIGHRRDVYQ